MASRSENTVSNGTAHEKHHLSPGSFLLYNIEVSETTPIHNNLQNTPPITTDIKYLYNITKTKNYEESMEDTTRQKTLRSLVELTL